MKLEVKRLAFGAKLPTRAHETDAGLDLYVHMVSLSGSKVRIYTGVAVAIPKQHVGMLFPRSSVVKKDLRLANSVGIIDSDYRGELILNFDRNGPQIYDLNERCGQLIVFPYPQIELVEVADLGATERGEGGFGSSGK